MYFSYVMFSFVTYTKILSSLIPFVCLFVCLFRATSVAYGNSQARDQIEAVATGLTRSKLHLQPTPSSWQPQILNPLSEARD